MAATQRQRQAAGGLARRSGAILESLRAFAAANSEYGRSFAHSQNMHHTDAAALVEILNAERRGQPLTPARLAERIMLTTGATSSLLNRLETAGHVVRSRDQVDRRIVTLHSTSAIHRTAEAFHAPLATELATVLSKYSAAELDLVLRVVDDVSAVVTTAHR